MSSSIHRMRLNTAGTPHARLFLLPFLCLAAFAGCNRGPAMYQVRGKVLYKDGSVPTGGVAVIRLQPTEASAAEIRKGASSVISPDGSFDFYTKTPGDGVYAGDYAVTFAVQKSVMDATSLIPAKYGNPTASGFSVTVNDDVDDLSFELEQLPGVTGAKATGGAG